MGFLKDSIKGKLISKVIGEGSLSEGPEYFIVPLEKYAKWGEILVRKKCHMWQSDPILHPCIGKLVSIEADIIETKDSITADYITVNIIE